jgi:hypothetical protein
MSRETSGASSADVGRAIGAKIEEIRAESPSESACVRLAVNWAASKFNMTYAAAAKAHVRYQRSLKDAGEPVVHGNSRVPESFVAMFFCFVLLMASSGLPLSRQQMATVLINNVAHFKPPVTDDEEKLRKHRVATESWVRRHVDEFEKKKGYKAAVPKALYKNRSVDAVSMRNDCEHFANAFGAYVDANGDPPPHTKVNFDECRITYHSDMMLLQRIFAYGVERPQARDRKDETTGSLISFMAANGERLLDVMCIKASKFDNSGFVDVTGIQLPKEELQMREQRGGVPLLYCFSETGYFSKEQILAALDELAVVWCRKVGTDAAGAAVLRLHVFCDNLAAHKDPDMLIKLLALNIVVWMLAANTSHFTQPSDSTPFAVFKSTVRRQAAGYVLDALLTGTDPVCFAIRAAHDARKKLSPVVIQSGFKNTHLHPFNVQNYMKFVDVNLKQMVDLANAHRYVETAERVVDLVRGMTATAQKRVDERAKSTTTLSGKLSSASLRSGPQLARHMVDQARVREFEAEVAATQKLQKELDKEHEKEAKKGRHVCRHVGCGATHTARRKDWFECDCGDFVFCPQHKLNNTTTGLWLSHKVTDCANAYSVEAVRRNAALTAKLADAAEKPCLMCDESADNGQLAIQCGNCECWVHAACVGGLTREQAEDDDLPFWCSQECALDANVAAPAIFNKDGAALPPRQVLPVPVLAAPRLGITPERGTYSAFVSRRLPALGRAAQQVAAEEAARKAQRKRKVAAEPAVTPAAKKSVAPPALVDADEDEEEDDGELSFGADGDGDERHSVDDEPVDDDDAPVGVQRSLNYQLSLLASGAAEMPGRRRTRAVFKRRGSS